MGFFNKIFRLKSKQVPHTEQIKDKQSFLEYVDKQLALRNQRANDVYSFANDEYFRKIEEIGQDKADEWYKAELAKAKCESQVQVRSNDMHYFEERFFRITKSSPDIAKLSAEGRHFIHTIPGTIAHDAYGTYGLCFTTASSVIEYLGYGDELTELNFNQSALANAGLSEEMVSYTPHGTKEYFAQSLLIKSKESLAFPETLKKAIKFSDNQSFFTVLTCQSVLRFEEQFTKFGLTDTLHAWQNVMKCARDLEPLTEDKLNFIRENIDKIIPEFTLDDKIAELKTDGTGFAKEGNTFVQSEEER